MPDRYPFPESQPTTKIPESKESESTSNNKTFTSTYVWPSETHRYPPPHLFPTTTTLENKETESRNSSPATHHTLTTSTRQPEGPSLPYLTPKIISESPLPPHQKDLLSTLLQCLLNLIHKSEASQSSQSNSTPELLRLYSMHRQLSINFYKLCNVKGRMIDETDPELMSPELRAWYLGFEMGVEDLRRGRVKAKGPPGGKRRTKEEVDGKMMELYESVFPGGGWGCWEREEEKGAGGGGEPPADEGDGGRRDRTRDGEGGED